MPDTDVQQIISGAGLKVTPQRVAVLRAVKLIDGHPSPEDILKYVHTDHPSIARGTIYHILESFVDKGILTRVKTDKGAMLYDATHQKHHHLYCNDSDRIEDYYDRELDELLEDYFRRKKINDFEIRDIKLQLIGKFRENNSQS